MPISRLFQDSPSEPPDLLTVFPEHEAEGFPGIFGIKK
jgi:hypothetical protein